MTREGGSGTLVYNSLINGVISIAQTVTISFGIGAGGEVAIGEILDPVNDLVERFSQVMAVVISSLALQKILLVITANKIFSIILTLAGVISVFAIMLRTSISAFQNVFKIFILLVVIRFSLGFAVLLNSAVDHMFLINQTEEADSQLGKLSVNVSNFQSATELSSAARLEIQASINNYKISLEKIKAKDIPRLIETQRNNNLKLVEAEKLISALGDSAQSTAIDKLKDWDIKGSYNAYRDKDPKTKRAIDTVIRLKVEKDNIEKKLESKEELTIKLLENIKNKEDELSGEEGGIYRKFIIMKNSLSPSVIEKNISILLPNIFKLIAIYILKVIILPLLFFYLIIYFAKVAWRTNWGEIIES